MNSSHQAWRFVRDMHGDDWVQKKEYKKIIKSVPTFQDCVLGELALDYFFMTLTGMLRAIPVQGSLRAKFVRNVLS